ncbi:fasciclin-like arabinogalactan protein 4 [Brachypodium distachyon]|nr:fasciclin-like arabinogalactan protein 4 [Brachypodium distachyon]|eukprot:XP_003566183.2 fasciclin-like arabinogalactan protein 4 [Brachypodium distachyon]
MPLISTKRESQRAGSRTKILQFARTEPNPTPEVYSINKKSRFVSYGEEKKKSEDRTKKYSFRSWLVSPPHRISSSLSPHSLTPALAIALCSRRHGEMRGQIPPILLVVLAAAALLPPQPAAAVDVAAVLAPFPDLAGFARLLASSPVGRELAGRSSLTLLAVPDRDLPQSPSAFAAAAGADLADVLRYHVLLEYLAPADLRRLPASGKLVTTLFQTTGRASSDLGAVNITAGGSSLSSTLAVVRSPAPFPASNATVLGSITAVPYNLSVLSVSGLIVPSGFSLSASESRPAPAVNITRILSDARGFNVAASMLEASGVAEEFEDDERGAGITVFVPTDDAFASLPAGPGDRLQSLPAERKAVVLRYHVLHSYYPLGSLESIVNPLQPTLATEFSSQAGRFTLNITRANGSVAIDTGVVQATITRTVFDQNPVAVFAVSKVLLPKEMFTRSTADPADIVAAGVAAIAPPPPAAGSMPPESARTPPTKLSSPPGMRGGDGGGNGNLTALPSSAMGRRARIGWWCIALLCCF